MIYLILGLALLLRLVSLNQSFWLDEATSALVVRDLSFSQILTAFLPGDFHPPFYYLALKTWSLVLGTSEIGLRSLSVLVGVATVWVVYKISKSKMAALFLATSGLHIYYSQEARMYVLATFFVCLSVLFFVKTLQKGRVGEWLGFGLSLALAALTHYLTILMVPVFWLWAIRLKQKRSWRKKFLVSHNILVLLGLLWLPTFLKQLKSGLGVAAAAPSWWQILGKTTPKEILLVPTKFMLGRVSLENQTSYLALVIIIGLVFSYFLLRSIKNSGLFWFWLTVPVLLTAFVGLRVSVFSYFRLLFVLPAFYILLAAGITKSGKKLAKLGVIFVLVVNLITSSVYLLNPRFQREDWRGLVRFIEGRRKESSLVIFVSQQTEAYRYYAPNAKIGGGADLSDKYQELWLMRYVQPIFDSQDSLRQKVESLGYEKQKEYDFNGIVVWQYQR
jgi:uncharacterized membrane protein